MDNTENKNTGLEKGFLKLMFGVAAGCATFAAMVTGYDAAGIDLPGLAEVALIYGGLAASAGIGYLSVNAKKVVQKFRP